MMKMKTERISRFLIFNEYDIHKDVVYKTVYLDYIPVSKFCDNDITERKLTAIGLVDRGLCNQKIAAQICGLHRNTVSKVIKTKQNLGIEAIFKDDRGLKAPYKYTGDVCLRIAEIIKDYPNLSDQTIAEKASLALNMKISRSSVARIRTRYQKDQTDIHSSPSKQELMHLYKVAESIDHENFDVKQLRLNFEQDPELKQKSKEFSKEPEPKAKRNTEQVLITRLKKGERNNFAGGLMHNLFLNEIGFNDLFTSYPFLPGSTYQSSEILATLFHSINQSIPSIEAFKLVDASRFGILIGSNRSPEKETIRDHLTQMASQYQSQQLIDQFARILIKKEQIDKDVFFIDGHFLPYYGLQVIAKGYYTVRRLAMKGNEIYAVTDIEGKPLFFITESNEIDFRPIISRCCDKIIELGISRPLLVFDREGYGIHFFKELGERADFITWAKYVGDDSLNRIPDSSFQICLLFNDHKYLVAEQHRQVTESLQTAQKDGREKQASINLRLIVIHNIQNDKRIGIYTNNTTKPAYMIAYWMLHRWGESENFFKEMMVRFNLNYHPGYDIKELERQPLIENPDIPLIRKAINILHKEVKELGKDIIVIQAKYSQRKDKRLKTKLVKLKQTLEEKKNDIIQFENKLKTLPSKVSILDVLKGKPLSRCDLEKKRLYDLMQFMAFHSREMLVSIFRNCYSDHRDVKQVLDMITTRSGYVKLIGQTLVVILDLIENKKHRAAALRLCQILNQKNLYLIGRIKLKLFFYISTIPLRGENKALTHTHNFN